MFSLLYYVIEGFNFRKDKLYVFRNRICISHKNGINLIFLDVDRIEKLLLEELNNDN